MSAVCSEPSSLAPPLVVPGHEDTLKGIIVVQVALGV